MKKHAVSFCADNDRIFLRHKKTNVDIFQSSHQLTFVGRRFSVADTLNAIGVSAARFDARHHEKMLLVNVTSGSFSTVTLKASADLAEDEFLATSHLREMLQLDESAEIYLCGYREFAFSKILPQKIDHIRENDLVIAEVDYNNLISGVSDAPYKHFEVYNSFSGESIIVKKSHVFPDKDIDSGTVRLSRKQRLSLGLELPQYLSEAQWETITKNLSSMEERQLICELYSADNHILDKSASYDKKSKAKKIISRYSGGKIKIIPVPESVCCPRKKLLRRICDFYVGKSTISLIGRRPYDIDEGLDIIRMSKSNMNLLGIDEMDKVFLQYKNNRVSCRVLELCDEDAFEETNLPISLNLVVGIPVHIRKKLQLMDLSSSVKIDRDTTFIFRKSINEQIVPILLTLFSTNLFSDASVILSALLSLIAVPLVLYFNLSSKRNMRA